MFCNHLVVFPGQGLGLDTSTWHSIQPRGTQLITARQTLVCIQVKQQPALDSYPAFTDSDEGVFQALPVWAQ